MKLKQWGASLALVAAAATAHAAPVQWTVASGGNGHWYEYIQTSATWQEALTAAAGMTHMGMTGYLATLTSAAEDRFASVTVAGGALAWFGATDQSDAAHPANPVNNWYWADGPEVGQALVYTNWAPGEPNNCCGGEDYAHTNWSGNAWNDHGGPGNPGQRNGFLVEYRLPTIQVPEPASFGLAGLALALTGWSRRRRAG